MRTQLGPLLQAENNDGDFTATQILLVTHVSICSQEQVKTCFFCDGEQIAISQLIPALLGCSANQMAFQI